jgi:hypothetical protein
MLRGLFTDMERPNNERIDFKVFKLTEGKTVD